MERKPIQHFSYPDIPKSIHNKTTNLSTVNY